MTVGRSSVTKYKQQVLRKYLETQIDRIGEKSKRGYVHFIDCTAGDMNRVNGICTSPETMFKVIDNQSKILTRLHLIEKNSNSCMELVKNFANLTLEGKANHPLKYKTEVIIRNCDWKQYLGVSNKKFFKTKCVDCNFNVSSKRWNDSSQPLIQHHRANPFGFLYFDPNGGTIEDLKALQDFFSKYERIDVGMNINILTWKRNQRNKLLTEYQNYNLFNVIESVNKKHIWFKYMNDDLTVEDKKSNYQWLMIFASNWHGSFPPSELRNFHNYRSNESKQILRDLFKCRGEK